MTCRARGYALVARADAARGTLRNGDWQAEGLVNERSIGIVRPLVCPLAVSMLQPDSEADPCLRVRATLSVAISFVRR